jgi:hypothetical protein
MNTTIKQINFNMPAARMNGESTLPPLSKYEGWLRGGDSGLPEEDGLYIGYGGVHSPFPYRMQDMYTRELYDTEIHAVVLENAHLKATFLPEYGGKLMSLFDKDAGRELLSVNPVIRPCNLAIRNAWMSGGVEWNCGMFGHHVHTCETMFTTTTTLEDGTPVLRMYEYERIRRCVQQMDFFLPEDSKLLFARMRVKNTVPRVIPMYWWSNTAAPETPKSRVIVNADGSYVADNNISLVDIPMRDGADVTYPVNIPSAVDYFYKIPDRKRKFECQVDEGGYGLIQTSTSRLKGRKLFAWGQGPGGDRWQEYLTVDGSEERYTELQAGLANTQYECLPMPPRAAWEWLEAYGAINADPVAAHGEWQGAKAEAAARLDELITEEALEDMLDDTRAMATSPATGELMFRGSGWGALENLRREIDKEPAITPHLDFGTVGEEQAEWVQLLEKGYMPEHEPTDVPPSWMLQEEFVSRLAADVQGADICSWYVHMQYGMSLFADGKFVEALEQFQKSMELRESPWALYGIGQIKRVFSDKRGAAVLCLRAARMMPDDVSFAKEAMALLVDAGMDTEALEFASEMKDNVSGDGRVKLYIIMANIHKDNIDTAEKLLLENGGLVVADIREGENIITDMWFMIEEKKAARDGREFDRESADVPAILDYRTTAKRKKKMQECK